jgi:glutamate-ammonia-ligase adenylyltransferase
MPPPTADPSPISALPRPIHAWIEDSPDPVRVSRYIDEFAARHPSTFNLLAVDAERARWLPVIFGCSAFLSEEILRRPEWLACVADFHQQLSADDYKERLADFLQKRAVSKPAALDLAMFRRRELLRIVLRDRMGVASLAAVTDEISSLADSILAYALATVTQHVEARHGKPWPQGHNALPSPAVFTVVALGKLGGRELNYSSDIDLMFLYSDNGETSGPHVISNKEFFKKVANQFTNLLSTYTAAGVCYRVDLRLRPEGTLGEVCLSLPAAKEYYSKRARDWELQMLIKARVAAGNHALGQALLDFVEPSIYSTTLDFSTIETMSVTRERITEKLARKRFSKDVLDVKLARGGIRDIEFLVQCLQRLHGAREAWVRHGGTLLALERLHDRDLLSTTEYSRLVDAYEYLRRMEHLLQLEDDRQTHTLPANPAELERLARRMNAAQDMPRAATGISAHLLKDLNQRLENVQVIYERIVHAQRPLLYSPLSSNHASGNHQPAEERGEGDVSGEILEALAKPAPLFAERLRQRGVHGSERALNAFLSSLLREPQQLPLLNSHRALADWMLEIFELSPYLGEQLARFPELVEEIRRAVDHPTRRWAFEGLAAPLNDIGGLRRFYRREMFRIQATSICLRESVFVTLDNTSALAEFVIARAYRIALEKALAHARLRATVDKPFFDPQNEMMVVALGRLGMREFDLASDADLLFIVPDAEGHRQRFWTRVAEHLIEILTTYTGDGTILSLDTRLRPNGREGMLVQTESTYRDYFSTKAEAWEGIAYMKARGVAGDTDRATAFLNELQKVDWRRWGQSGRSRQDLRQMRLRLQREQGTAAPLKATEGGYYDADFILMYLRLKGAGMFYKSLNTPERIDVVEKMGHLDCSEAEFLLESTTYFRALDHALRVVTGRTEERIPAAPEQRAMIAELMQRWTGRRSASASLDADLLSLQKRMRRVFDSVFTH